MPGFLEDIVIDQNRVRAALNAADGLTAQQVGESASLSKSLSLPPGLIEASPDRARQELAFKKISQSEAFARWAEQKRENAALARDDTEGLLGAFRAVENFGNRVMRWAVFSGDIPDMGRQLVHGAADFNRALAGTAQGISDAVFGPDSAPSRYLQGVQEWVKWARPAEVKADTWLGQLGYDFLRSVPQQVGNIAAAMANPAAALSLMGVQIAGGSYAELREAGVSPGRALASSVTNAAAQAPLEKLGLDRFMSIFRSASFRDTIGRTLGSMETEFMTEYLQKYPEVVTNLWALAEKESPDAAEQIRWFGDRLFDAETLTRANREGLYEGLIGAMWGGIGGGVRSLAVRDMARRKALDFAQNSLELHSAVESTQAKQVAPEHMEDALAGASDVLAQSVYIPAQAALDMAERGQDILTPLGITPEQARQALESGADLEVSLATLQARLDSAAMESVAQIMRQTADAPNALEAAQVDSAAQAQAVVEDARRRLRRNDAVRKEEARLVSEMLPLAGNRDAAEQYAKLFRAQATAFETAYGVDAVESLRRVRVERGEETARGTEDESGALGQAAMYRARESGIIDFVERVLAEAPDAKKSYFVLRDVTTARAGFNRVSVELASDQVRHDARRHPGNTIWEEIPDVIEQGEVYSGRGDPVTGEKSIIFVRSDGESADVVMGTIVRGKRGKKGKQNEPVLRFRVGTAFRDKAKAVEHWMSGKRDATPFPSDEEITSYPRQEGVPYGSGRDIPENRLPEDRRPVNAPAPFAASPDTFLSEDDAAPRTLFQDETDGAPESGRAYPDNGREVGVITGEIAATLALDKPGPIVLDDTGRRHVEERHGKEIRSLGFADAQEFISFVLSHVDAVYAVEGHSRKYDIVSRAMTPQGRVMVRLEFDAAGDYYSVATAGPVRPQYYNKKSPLWERAQSSHSASGTPDAISGQSGELRQDAATEINLTSGAAKGKRASVTFQPDGSAIIRIFKGADLSSIPHESAHVFIDDLRRVAADDGGIARERLRADLEQAGMDMEPFSGLLSGEIDVEGARAMLRDMREGLAVLDDGDAALRAAQKEAAQGKPGAEIREDIRAALKANETRRRALLAQESVLSAYVRHLDGLAQARRDIATLRRFAGVSEAGELTADQWRDVQEYAARGFEQYLYEGKAPSRELAGVFSRMMRWLKSLYASWRQYVGADLNEDVRRVFDRLLIADAEVQNNVSVRAAFEQERDFLDDAALTEQERLELEALRDRAEAEVTAKRDRAVARERGRRYREAFDEAKETLQNAPFWVFIGELTRKEKPLYEGAPRVGGINRDSLVEYLGEDMTVEIARKMPRLVNNQGGGSSLDVLEVEYNLADGDADALAHMIYDVIVVQDAGVNKLAARQAEQTLAEQDKLSMPEDGLLAGEEYGKYLEAVEKAMNRLGRERQAQNEQAAARRMERESLPERYYRNLARREVAEMSISQLSPNRYVAALRRALSERSRAVRRGAFVDAVRAMRRARMAFALMQETKKARELADRVEKKARKAARVKSGTYPAAQTEAIRKLVSALGFPAPLRAWDAEMENVELEKLVRASMDESVIDLMPLFPDWLLELKNPDPAAARRGEALDWRGLRMDEVEQAENLLDFLVHSGREQSRTDKDSLRARVQAVADSAAASMSDMRTMYMSRRDSLADKLAKGFSSIDSLEWECRKADGYQNVPGRKNSAEGVVEREIYMRLRAATDRYHARLASTQKAVTPHLVRLLESAQAWEKKYGKKTLNIRDEKGNVAPVPDAIRRAGDPGWTSEMVIGMALNLGNEGNRERLRSSYADTDGRGGLTFDMVSLILGDDAAATLYGLDAATMAQLTSGRRRRDGILSADDWRAIQGVWDVMGSQWADTQAAHKKLYGFAPRGIEPGAFTVRIGTETVQMPGGYYPIKYDPLLDVKARAQEGKEDILDRSEGIFGVPSARKGFTMGRVKHTGRSLRLGVDALQKHLVDSARFIELGYDVRMADKVINNPVFASEYQRVYGVHDYDRIRPNLKSLVVDEVEPSSSLYKAAELARKHLVYYALSMNINTSLMQLTAVFPAVGDVGALNVARGIAQLTTRGMGLVRDVWKASPYMERRFRNIDQDLARKALKFQPGRGMSIIRGGKVYTWDDVANVGMMPIALSDLAITTAIWSGAYHKRMKELGSKTGKIDATDQNHAEAVAYADKVIAQSNPDNDALSRSAFGRDKGVARLFNSFSGATTKFAQRTRYMYQGMRRGRVSLFEFGRMELYDMFMPAVAMTVLQGLIQGAFGGGDDDDKRLAKLALSNTIGQLAMAVPVFGNPAADMLTAALGGGSGRRGELSSAINTPLQLAGTVLSRGGTMARKGEVDGEKLLMSTLDIASYVSRIPVGPVTRRTMRGLEQWEKGEGTPFSWIRPASD